MASRIRCPYCGAFFRIPEKYTKSRGRCPACRETVDLKLLLEELSSTKTAAQRENKEQKLLRIPSDLHPMVYLLRKHSESLKQYGEDLQKIYTLIRKRYVHRKEYEKQKMILKKQIFSPIINDAIRLPDFTLSIENRIMLWKLLFTILPYTYPDKDSEVTFNLYPRYDFAALVSLSYALGGYDDFHCKKEILRKGIKGERTTPKMKQLFREVNNSSYGKTFSSRIRFLLEETPKIAKSAPENRERRYRQIEEDFSFGFSWAAFHLSSENAGD